MAEKSVKEVVEELVERVARLEETSKVYVYRLRTSTQAFELPANGLNNFNITGYLDEILKKILFIPTIGYVAGNIIVMLRLTSTSSRVSLSVYGYNFGDKDTSLGVSTTFGHIITKEELTEDDINNLHLSEYCKMDLIYSK